MKKKRSLGGQLQPRKQPRQSRSKQMNSDLLEAAARVLSKQGAEHFTTNHVAEAAGVSVGSLYQYYPNKASLLLGLHEREAAATWQKLSLVLQRNDLTPRERIEQLIQAFFSIQGEAQAHHDALNQSHAAVATTPAFLAFEKVVVANLEAFLRAVRPDPNVDHAFLAQLAFTVATSVGERLSLRQANAAEMTRTGEVVGVLLADALGL